VAASRLLEAVLPSSVIVVETREDHLDVELFPEEELALGRAVDKRRREFVTGRACAREALAQLGLPATPVGSGPHGEPLWPPGVVGSITHCEGYRACAVARSNAVLALGIDAERDARVSEEVWEDIAHGSEQELRTRAPEARGPHLDAVLFSAKEAIYKAWFPLERRWLGFDDVLVSVDPAAGTFTARLLVPAPQRGGAPFKDLAGRWATDGGIVVTAVAVAPRSGRARAWPAILAVPRRPVRFRPDGR
jgi:4'-phosphopantetheinyl transferase EntD